MTTATLSYNPEPKLVFIDDAVSELLRHTGLLQEQVFERLVKYLGDFDVINGKYADNSRAIKLLNELDDTIREIIDKSKYKNDVLNFIRSYDEIEKFNRDAQRTLNKIEVGKKLLTDKKEFQTKLSVDTLLGSGVDDAFSKPLTKALTQNIILGSSVTAVKDYLHGYILGDEEKQGVLSRYSGTYARDLVASYDGIVNQTIQQDFDLDAFLYVGSLVKDSRPQCVRWVNEFNGELLLADLPDEIDWAFSNGSGMKPETTAETFAVYRGGWNCRHSAIPFKSKK